MKAPAILEPLTIDEVLDEGDPRRVRPNARRVPARNLRRAAFAALVAALLVAGTSCLNVTVLGGVVVVFETDGSLDPDTLHVTVTSDAGKTLWDVCYPITTPASFFPTTLAIASDGNPTASVTLVSSVLKGPVTLDTREMVFEVPTNQVRQLSISFSARCTPLVSSTTDPAHGSACGFGVAPSLCPANETCDPASGTCVSDTTPGDAGVASGQPETDGGDATIPVGDGGQSLGQCESGTCLGDADASGEASSVDAADAGIPSAAPHCAPGGPGLTDCGSAKESCCASLEVPGGTYYRTYDLDPLGGGGDWTAPEGGAPVGLADPATISTFRLDKYDVTVGRFRQFVNAWNDGAGWTPPAGSGKHTHLNGGAGLVNVGDDAGLEYEPGWLVTDDSSTAPTNANLACTQNTPQLSTWTNAPGSQENLPINCVSWSEAYAFCIWDGGFLPSEAEWEYAAAGGNQQRSYPWGSADPGTTSQYAIYGCYYPSGPPGFKCSGVSNIAPVGTVTASAGLFGHLDLAGEMYQWNLDWFDSYGPSGDSLCTDCANLAPTFGRVVRGGDWAEDETTLLAAYRNFLFKEAPFDGDRDPAVGVRCARIP